MTRASIDRLFKDPIRRLRNRWSIRRLRAELTSLPEHERDSALRDAGLSRYDIEHLPANHPGPDKLLPQRLAALGIDLDYLRESAPAVYRDLQRVCSVCRNPRKCARDLRRGDVDAGMRDYCPNAGTLDAWIVGARSSGLRK